MIAAVRIRSSADRVKLFLLLLFHLSCCAFAETNVPYFELDTRNKFQTYDLKDNGETRVVNITSHREPGVWDHECGTLSPTASRQPVIQLKLIYFNDKLHDRAMLLIDVADDSLNDTVYLRFYRKDNAAAHCLWTDVRPNSTTTLGTYWSFELLLVNDVAHSESRFLEVFTSRHYNNITFRLPYWSTEDKRPPPCTLQPFLYIYQISEQLRRVVITTSRCDVPTVTYNVTKCDATTAVSTMLYNATPTEPYYFDDEGTGNWQYNVTLVLTDNDISELSADAENATLTTDKEEGLEMEGMDKEEGKYTLLMATVLSISVVLLLGGVLAAGRTYIARRKPRIKVVSYTPRGHECHLEQLSFILKRLAVVSNIDVEFHAEAVSRHPSGGEESSLLLDSAVGSGGGGGRPFDYMVMVPFIDSPVAPPALQQCRSSRVVLLILPSNAKVSASGDLVRFHLMDELPSFIRYVRGFRHFRCLDSVVTPDSTVTGIMEYCREMWYTNEGWDLACDLARPVESAKQRLEEMELFDLDTLDL